jgi:hypothetical protein
LQISKEIWLLFQLSFFKSFFVDNCEDFPQISLVLLVSVLFSLLVITSSSSLIVFLSLEIIQQEEMHTQTEVQVYKQKNTMSRRVIDETTLRIYVPKKVDTVDTNSTIQIMAASSPVDTNSTF